MATAANQAGLIDTDILVDASRGLQDAVDFLDGQRAHDGAPLSVVSAMELVGGREMRQDLQVVQQFLTYHRLVPVSAAASQTAFELMESFYLSHGLLIADALIAATALDQQLVLFTKNVRHYQMVPDPDARRPS